MNDSGDIQSLQDKIKAARQQKAEGVKAPESDSRQGVQAGIELAGAIFISTAIGYGIDSYFETKPAFLLIMFFLGVCTGFYNIYRLINNMGTAVGVKNQKKAGARGLVRCGKRR
ncbi:MAG: AtpZ/AtpI family protein [Alphaproteobacteria bacterium]|nr:AtpZ/AtpI family protein [Alphaproteobacteria bacterium]